MKKILLLVLSAVAVLSSGGCRTFNWTKEDATRERGQMYEPGLMNGGRGWDLKKTEVVGEGVR